MCTERRSAPGWSVARPFWTVISLVVILFSATLAVPTIASATPENATLEWSDIYGRITYTAAPANSYQDRPALLGTTFPNGRNVADHAVRVRNPTPHQVNVYLGHPSGRTAVHTVDPGGELFFDPGTVQGYMVLPLRAGAGNPAAVPSPPPPGELQKFDSAGVTQVTASLDGNCYIRHQRGGTIQRRELFRHCVGVSMVSARGGDVIGVVTYDSFTNDHRCLVKQGWNSGWTTLVDSKDNCQDIAVVCTDSPFSFLPNWGAKCRHVGVRVYSSNQWWHSTFGRFAWSSGFLFG